MGSVAERVLALSPVPLLLRRPGGQYVSRIKSVLVPVDGSPGGALALGAAVDLAEASGASLRLFENDIFHPALLALILAIVFGTLVSAVLAVLHLARAAAHEPGLDV